MSLTVSAKGGADFDPVPAGTHIGRCVTVVDLGMQEGGAYGPKHKVYIGFEIPSVRVQWKKDDVEHEGPAIIGSTYTASISDRAILGQQLSSWRGRAFTEEEREAFDLFTILDVPVMISVSHKKTDKKTYANVSALMGLPPGVTCPPRETDLLKYSPEDPESDISKLPEWMQNKISDGTELGGKQSGNDGFGDLPPATPDGFDDDIPF